MESVKVVGNPTEMSDQQERSAGEEEIPVSGKRRRGMANPSGVSEREARRDERERHFQFLTLVASPVTYLSP